MQAIEAAGMHKSESCDTLCAQPKYQSLQLWIWLYTAIKKIFSAKIMLTRNKYFRTMKDKNNRIICSSLKWLSEPALSCCAGITGWLSEVSWLQLLGYCHQAALSTGLRLSKTTTAFKIVFKIHLRVPLPARAASSATELFRLFPSC